MRFLTVDNEKCLKCGMCAEACQFGALLLQEEIFFKAAACIAECRACELASAQGAVEILECAGCESCGGCKSCKCG